MKKSNDISAKAEDDLKMILEASVLKPEVLESLSDADLDICLALFAIDGGSIVRDVMAGIDHLDQSKKDGQAKTCKGQIAGSSSNTDFEVRTTAICGAKMKRYYQLRFSKALTIKSGPIAGFGKTAAKKSKTGRARAPVFYDRKRILALSSPELVGQGCVVSKAILKNSVDENGAFYLD